MTPGRLLWLLRRDFNRGWDATYHDYCTLPRITRWRLNGSKNSAAIPVHLLTGKGDWLLAAWMLASFFHFTGLSWPVVIHDDGTLPQSARETLQTLFAEVRYITRAEADKVMSHLLRSHPQCAAYRASHPLGLKIFDMAHFAAAERFIVLDSDVLFFRPPVEILDWARRLDSRECWFNEDVQEASLLSVPEAREKLGVELWPRVNSGLCLIHRAAIDFDFCERVLAETSILQGKIWRIEQTLFALCASRHGAGGLLPKTYEVTLNRDASPNVTARHYVNAVRQRFFGEGLKRLQSTLLKR